MKCDKCGNKVVFCQPAFMFKIYDRRVEDRRAVIHLCQECVEPMEEQTISEYYQYCSLLGCTEFEVISGDRT